MSTQPDVIASARDTISPATVRAQAAQSYDIRRKRAFEVLRSSQFILIDLALLVLALLQMGIALSMRRNGTTFQTLLQHDVATRDLLLLVVCVAGWSAVLWAGGIYRQHHFRQLSPRIPAVALLSTLVLYVACRMFRPETQVRGPIIAFACAATIALFVPRAVLLLWSRVYMPTARAKRNVVLVGSGQLAQHLVWTLRNHSKETYVVLGFVDSEPQAGRSREIGAHLGTLDDLEALLMTNVVDEVHIALPFKSHYSQIQEAVRLCESAGVEPHYMAELFPTQVTKRVQTKDGRVALRLTHDDSRWVLKRALDLTVATVTVVLASPLLLVVALLVRLSGPGPIVFKQTRYGLNKRPFTMFKFRSMVSDAEQRQKALEEQNEAVGPVFKIAHDPRTTPIGAFLRKMSLDELPQLFNVLAGHMSLVGPRPLNLRDVRSFSELHLMRRFSVVPGMTGLWQVSGRSNLSFDSWIELDLKYIDEWSLKLDFEILARTLPAVLKGRGAS